MFLNYNCLDNPHGACIKCPLFNELPFYDQNYNYPSLETFDIHTNRNDVILKCCSPFNKSESF